MLDNFIGLSLLLVSVGGIFFLWMQKLRPATPAEIEAAELNEHPQNQPLELRSPLAYVSSEDVYQDSEQGAGFESSSSASNEDPATSNESGVQNQGDTGQVVAEEDAVAETHLGLAQQFFDLGDFEGAMDFTLLVLENADASQDQRSRAKSIRSLCR